MYNFVSQVGECCESSIIRLIKCKLSNLFHLGLESPDVGKRGGNVAFVCVPSSAGP